MKRAITLGLTNFIGCIVLGGLLVTQWVRNSHIQKKYEEAELFKNSAISERDQLQKNLDLLKRDLAQLKESISTLQTENSDLKKHAETGGQVEEQLRTELKKAQDALDAWKQALEQRDAKINEMAQALTATRARLEEAVNRLKQGTAH